MKGYHSKVPRKNLNLPRCHYVKVGHSKWKMKKQFSSQERAEAFIHHLHSDKVAYLCPICNKWHIGSKK